MSQIIIVTTPQNSGLGTPLATAFTDTNRNFSELYARYQTEPPGSLTGRLGDIAGMYATDSLYFYYCFAEYDGISVIWAQVTQIGNISVSQLNNGSSNVVIAGSGANATISIAGTPNVAVFAADGLYAQGVVSATGNVRGAYILGNGSQLVGLPATYSNAEVAAYLPVYSGNISADTVVANAVSAVTVTGGNLVSQGTISATANIVTAGYFVGDFVGNIVGTLTNIPGPNGAVIFNDGNGNAAATAGLVFDNSGPNLLTVLGSVSATANVVADTVIASNITGTLTTAVQTAITTIGTLGVLSVAGNTQSGNLRTAGAVSATGNIFGNNITTLNDLNVGDAVSAVSYTGTTVSVVGNITGGNLITTGIVSAVGNVAGTYILGNGSQLTGMPIQYDNTNVAVYLAAFGANNISTTGNIISSTIISGELVGANLSVSGNVSATNTISATGTVTGGTLSSTGTVTGGNLATGGTVSAAGNIAGGNVSTVGILTVNSNNNNIAIVNGGSNGAGNIGSSTRYFNTVFAKATSAEYADLAECYTADAAYVPGTVLSFGGTAEVTQTDIDMDPAVIGVVSTNPAYCMNTGLKAQHVAEVALAGRVMCHVQGPIRRGQMMVSAGQGRARAEAYPIPGSVIGKALENFDSNGFGVIEVVVGRL
jgi:hypothetical protein